MKVEVLVATMNQNDHSLLDKMNIQSNCIIANQCNKNEIEDFIYKGYNIKFLSFAERGVGLNRNNALMRAKADISIIADDDMIFIDNYEDKIKRIFNDNPKADVIILNLIESTNQRFQIKKKFKVNYKNFMRFGAARLVFRTKSVTKHGISFNLHFGGGTDYSAGEDVLFLNDCLKKDLNVIAVPDFIAELLEGRESTWFKGYTDKYFIDKGILYSSISKKWAWLLGLLFSLRRRNLFRKDKTWKEAYKLILQGIKKNKSD